MKETIFDLVEQPISEGKQGYFDIAEKAPQPKDDSWLNQVADYGKTILKGSIEGLGRLGRIMGPLETEKNTSQQLEEQTQNLDALLPTQEGYIQNSLRRGLREAPSILSFPGSGLQAGGRSILAGFAGEGAKELGFPEWAQTAAELTSYIGPDITKKLLEKGSNAELIAAARKLGLSDEAITPLMQSEFKQKWLAKLSPKRGATQKALQKTKSELGDAYGMLQKSEGAGLEITEKANGTLINELYSILNEMPREIRGKIEKDLKDLLTNKITGNTLMNFYKDVNSLLKGNTKQLSLLKDPIKKAISSVSPELSKDFEFVNKLYSKYSSISSKLKPNLTSDIISAAEALGVFGGTLGVAFGHYPTLVGILGEQAAKKLAQQMLINPKFQQISQKMVVALNQNKYGLAQKLTSELRDLVKKYSPEMADEINNFSKEDFEELLKSNQQEKASKQ